MAPWDMSPAPISLTSLLTTLPQVHCILTSKMAPVPIFNDQGTLAPEPLYLLSLLSPTSPENFTECLILCGNRCVVFTLIYIPGASPTSSTAFIAHHATESVLPDVLLHFLPFSLKRQGVLSALFQGSTPAPRTIPGTQQVLHRYVLSWKNTDACVDSVGLSFSSVFF